MGTAVRIAAVLAATAGALVVGVACLFVSLEGFDWVRGPAWEDLSGGLGLALALSGPLVAVTVLVGELTGERRLAYYVLVGVISSWAPMFLFTGFAPLFALRVAAAGGVGGAVYWALVGRTARAALR